MDEFLKYIEKGLSGSIEYFQFSIDLEHYLVDNYDKMYSDNKNATVYLNDLLPDETEKMEPGMDPTEFYNKVRVIVEKSKEL